MRGLGVTICTAVLAASCSVASAATFTVTGLGDPAGATCAGTTTCPSLRAAINAADLVANTGSTVMLGAGTFTLGGSGSAGGPLSITQDLTIAGAGEASTIVEQTAPTVGVGVVQIAAPTAHVTISGLTITGGQAAGVSQTVVANPPNPGLAGGDAVGGILDDGALTLDGVSVTANQATGGSGQATGNGAPPGPGGNAVGGIEVAGSLTLNGSSVTGNSAVGGAAGIAEGDANGAIGGFAVGGVAVDPGAGAAQVSSSDLSGNVATGGAGSLSNGAPSNKSGAGGQASGGLGELAAQPLSISSSTIDTNTATGGAGGGGPYAAIGGAGGSADGAGIYADHGTLTVSDSAVDGNLASGGAGGQSVNAAGSGGDAVGGGIDLEAPATLTVERSTISLDTATGGSPSLTGTGAFAAAGNGGRALGGGATVDSAGTLVNVTVAEDVADGAAGGAPPFGSSTSGVSGEVVGGGVNEQTPATLTLASDTFASDAVESQGGGMLFGGDFDDGNQPVSIADTIFAGGVGAGNCAIFAASAVTDGGHNLESSSPSQCRLTAASDIVGSDPQLGQLTDHGGLGPTLAPAPSSPVRGAGGACTDPSQPGDPPLASDERGAPRHAQCDIGAYETQPPAVTSPPALSGPAVVGSPLSCPTTGFSGDGTLSFTFTWLRGTAAITGAVSGFYTPSPGDAGQALSCSVTAANAYGSVSSASNALLVQTGTSTTTTPTGTTPTITTTSTTPIAASTPKFAGAALHPARLIADGKGHLSLTLVCPSSTPGGRCIVKISVFARTGALPARAQPERKRKRPRPAALLARGSARLKSGHTLTLKLKLTTAGRSATRKLPAAVRVVVVSSDGAGTRVTHSSRVNVSAAKRRRARR